MTEIKPCPFCGKDDIVIDCNSYGDVDDYFALCNNLECVTEGPTRTTEKEAITAWNTRAPIVDRAEAAESFYEDQEDIPPEFVKVVDENLFDLV